MLHITVMNHITGIVPEGIGARRCRHTRHPVPSESRYRLSSSPPSDPQTKVLFRSHYIFAYRYDGDASTLSPDVLRIAESPSRLSAGVIRGIDKPYSEVNVRVCREKHICPCRRQLAKIYDITCCGFFLPRKDNSTVSRHADARIGLETRRYWEIAIPSSPQTNSPAGLMR